jgi:acetyl esterase/lipase
VSAGWAVAMPSYRLTLAVSLKEIVQDIAQSLNKVAAIIDGPIVLAGHSARSFGDNVNDRYLRASKTV